jgi:hypothetical protein
MPGFANVDPDSAAVARKGSGHQGPRPAEALTGRDLHYPSNGVGFVHHLSDETNGITLAEIAIMVFVDS